MLTSGPVLQTSIRLHHTYRDCSAALATGLADRLDPRDERGDVAPRTVGIAVMAALAISVGAIITAKVTNKANEIPLGGNP
jgi:hypothetical protein